MTFFVELLITLGVISILLGIGFVNLRTPASSLFAQDLKAQLMQARQEAVKRNGPVAVVWQESFEEVTTRFTDTRDWAFSSSPCFDSPATVLRTRSASEYGSLAIEVDPSDVAGTVFLPNGQRRGCDGADCKHRADIGR
ncbi:MAG: GspH/FimT family pseudopilin [Trueperaceae bacterium]|nr:GspH/FimT family pseudopilin [Trueperaceae bacterium]